MKVEVIGVSKEEACVTLIPENAHDAFLLRTQLGLGYAQAEVLELRSCHPHRYNHYYTVCLGKAAYKECNCT